MKIPWMPFAIVFLIAALSSAGIYMLLAAQQMKAELQQPVLEPVTDDGGEAIAYAQAYDPADLQVIAEAPAFDGYMNALGEPFSSDALTGKIWVADFFFSSCPGICPVMMKNTAKLAKTFKDKPVEFVGFSVDPETDTPERLKAWGKKYGVDAEVWHLLTGPLKETARLSLEGFRLGSVEQPMDHSARMVLVDHEGNIRGYFSGTDDTDQENLNAAIEQLLKEMQ